MEDRIGVGRNLSVLLGVTREVIFQFPKIHLKQTVREVWMVGREGLCSR